MIHFITNTAGFIRKDHPFARGILKGLTLTHFTATGAAVVQRIYQSAKIGDHDYYILPKGRFIRLIKQHNERRYNNEHEQKAIMGGKIELKDEQPRAAEEIIEALNSTVAGNCLFYQNTGYGKTFVALGVMQKLGLKTVIIVPRANLMKQWFDTIHEYFPDARVETHSGKKKVKDVKEVDIVVAIVNSACRETIDWFKEFGFTIFDEVHMYCTSKFHDIFWKAQSRYSLGCTATPLRQDKMDNALDLHFARTVDFRVKETCWKAKAHVVRYTTDKELEIKYHEVTGMINFVHLMDQLVADDRRNEIIIEYTRKFIDNGHCVYVMSKRLSQVEKLYKMLTENKIDVDAPELKDEKIMALTGGASDEKVDEAKRESTVLVTTISYSGVGLSIDRYTALVLAGPFRFGSTQVFGRIFRKGFMTDKTRELLDIVDMKAGILKSQFRERRKEMIDRAFTIEYYNM